MIPILYPSNETEFRTNGICRLTDIISCTVTEERNGKFECEFQYPITGSRFADIHVGRIIYCTHDESQVPQAFDIYGRTAPLDGIVTFYAHHISYRLSNVILGPITFGSCEDFFSNVTKYCLNKCDFTFSTDRDLDTWIKFDAPIGLRQALGGVEGSVLDTYSPGEYTWDMFNVRFSLHRGEELDVPIRYGKNLTELEYEYDNSESYTAVFPFWKSLDGKEIVTLPEWSISSGHAQVTLIPWTSHQGENINDENGNIFEFAAPVERAVPYDLSGVFETKPTEEQLREKAASYMADNSVWEPTENIKIDFVALWNTDEYKDYAPLQRVKLCDTVPIIYEALGINVKKKVIRTVYNTLLERYDEIELGESIKSFADTVAQTVDVSNELSMMNATLATKKDVAAVSEASNAAIESMTRTLTGGAGGYIRYNIVDGEPREIYITSVKDLSEAQHSGYVIRLNSAGIGFSSTGILGKYTQGWNINGEFNTQLIRSGRISSYNGDTYFDLSNASLVTEKLVVINDTIYGSSSQRRVKISLNNGNLVFAANGVSFAGLYHTSPNSTTYHRMVTGGRADNKSALEIWCRSGNYESKSDGQFGILFSVEYLEDILNLTAGTYCALAIGGRRFCSGTGLLVKEAAIFPLRSRFIGRTYFGNGANGPYLYSDASNGDPTASADNTTLRIVGNVRISGNSGVYANAYNNLSDERLKTFYDWDEKYDTMLDRIETRIYRWRDGERSEHINIGFSAQDIQRALEAEGISDSSIVREQPDEEKYLTVDYMQLSALLHHRVKKQQAKIDELEQRLARLEELINANS